MASLLRLTLALLAATGSVHAAASSCHSHTGEALLRRVDEQLATCLPTNLRSLDAFQEALIANEMDATQRRPLAVAVFASQSSTLDRFAAAVATAVAGTQPTAHAVRVVDLTTAAASSRATHELTQALRHDMASALAACPQQRTVVLVRGMEAARGDQLPLLDVFLDPLNGKRATLYDAASARDLDCGRALFVFLYKTTADDRVRADAWQDWLVHTWRASVAGTQLTSEAFTPQALAGRLTTAVVLSEDEEAVASEACDLEAFLVRLQHARTAAGDHTAPLGNSLESSTQCLLGVAVLAVGLLLLPAKLSTAQSKHKGEVLRERKPRTKQKTKRLEHAEPDSARLASLRSHCHHDENEHKHLVTTVTTTTTTIETTVEEVEVPASPVHTTAAVHADGAASPTALPTSPVLTASVPPKEKTASPPPKTPTPTKPKRTGRGRKANSAPPTTKMQTRSRGT